jgi:hypothetical protein
MPDEPYEWDQKVPMAGGLPIYWSITVDDEGLLTGFISPYQAMPEEDENGDFNGTLLGLNQVLRSHPNIELAAAAQTFIDLAYQQWIKPTLTARIYRALVEQRDRQGGYESGLKVFDQEQEDKGYEP